VHGRFRRGGSGFAVAPAGVLDRAPQAYVCTGTRSHGAHRRVQRHTKAQSGASINKPCRRESLMRAGQPYRRRRMLGRHPDIHPAPMDSYFLPQTAGGRRTPFAGFFCRQPTRGCRAWHWQPETDLPQPSTPMGNLSASPDSRWVEAYPRIPCEIPSHQTAHASQQGIAFEQTSASSPFSPGTKPMEHHLLSCGGMWSAAGTQDASSRFTGSGRGPHSTATNDGLTP